MTVHTSALRPPVWGIYELTPCLGDKLESGNVMEAEVKYVEKRV